MRGNLQARSLLDPGVVVHVHASTHEIPSFLCVLASTQSDASFPLCIYIHPLRCIDSTHWHSLFHMCTYLRSQSSLSVLPSTHRDASFCVLHSTHWDASFHLHSCLHPLRCITPCICLHPLRCILLSVYLLHPLRSTLPCVYLPPHTEMLPSISVPFSPLKCGITSLYLHSVCKYKHTLSYSL